MPAHDPYIFYTLMRYPLPPHPELFAIRGTRTSTLTDAHTDTQTKTSEQSPPNNTNKTDQHHDSTDTDDSDTTPTNSATTVLDGHTQPATNNDNDDNNDTTGTHEKNNANPNDTDDQHLSHPNINTHSDTQDTQKDTSESDNSTRKHTHGYTSSHLQPYLERIRRRQRLWSWIPYVRSVYICNSVSFGATHDQSDIDLCILTTHHRTRLCRLWVIMVLRILRIHVTHQTKRLRFCPSFFLSHERPNLHEIALRPHDLYLAYWIAHAQCIYDADGDPHTLYRANTWIHEIIPDYEPIAHGLLPLRMTTHQSFTKRLIQWSTAKWRSRRGNLLERCLTSIRLPRILAKQRNAPPDSHRGCHVGPDILKFHKDIRKRVNALYKIALSTQPGATGGSPTATSATPPKNKQPSSSLIPSHARDSRQE